MPIPIACPSCATRLRAPDHMAGRKTKCPKCGMAVVVPSSGHEITKPTHAKSLPEEIPISSYQDRIDAAKPARVESSPQPVKPTNLAKPLALLPKSLPAPVVEGDKIDLEPSSHRQPSVGTPFSNTDVVELHPRKAQSLVIASWVAGAGLFILGFSPLFKWINFGTGGVIGLSGDGKIVLGVTIFAMAGYITASIKQKWITPVSLGIQAWGTLAVFWMGALIWKVGSIVDSLDMKDNPFAAIFATQISPGAGLYLGLVGGIAVAGALGFTSVHRAITTGSFKPYYTTQGLSCALGILIAFLVGPERISKHDSTKAASAPLTSVPDSLFGTKAKLPKLEQPPEASWAAPDKAVRQGDLQVQISKSAIVKVPLKSHLRDASKSQDDLLMVKLELTNMNPAKKVEYRSWSGKDFSHQRDYATLKDNFGNNYKRINFGFSTSPQGAVEGSVPIYPNKSVIDVLVFELPLDTVTHLDLELPADNYGGEGMLRFRIPIKSVSRE